MRKLLRAWREAMDIASATIKAFSELLRPEVIGGVARSGGPSTVHDSEAQSNAFRWQPFNRLTIRGGSWVSEHPADARRPGPPGEHSGAIRCGW